MRRFNVAGPCRAELHYMIPPEERLPELVTLIDHEAYFVVHAPRQTGKTTTLRALVQRLTAEGRYAALHFSCEMGRPFEDDVEAASKAVWSAIDRLGLEEGVLVVFDCRTAAEAIEDRTRLEEGRSPSGRRITVLRG